MYRAITAAAAALILAAAMPGANAASQDSVSVPSSIVTDCSHDVSAELATFLNAVPDNSVVMFSPGGCYRVERQMDLDRLVNVTLDGQGATLVRAEPTPLNMRYPEANGFLRLLAWTGGGVRNLNIQGINTTSDRVELGDAYGAWDQSMEFDAGINVRGGTNLLLENLHIDGTYGDGIQIQRWNGNPTGITVRDVVIGHNGRQGISISAANGVLIDRVTIQGSRRGGIDIEPAASTMVAQNIEIRNSTIASWLLAFPSQGSGLSNHIYIHDNVITRTGVPFVKVRSMSGLQRTDWRIVNNTVTWGLGSPQPAMDFENVTNILIDGNVIRLKDDRSQVAVGLGLGSTATVVNNWFMGGLDAPNYVLVDSSSSWVGGNNAVSASAPSATRWSPAPPVYSAPPSSPPTAATGGAPSTGGATPVRKRSVTKLSFDVREPARWGSPLQARGRLLKARSSSRTFRAYSGRTVLVQFRAKGQARFTTVLRLRTSSTGTFVTHRALSVTATGKWRAVFRGDSGYRAAASTPDFVKPRPAAVAASGGLLL
jgi:hypothetical protein